MEEIYNSNSFEKQEMLTWEQQPAATKMDYGRARAYFERIVKATDTYEQNAGGGTAGCNCYKSANQLAKYGNKIREYIQQLASAGAANATDNAVNVQTKEKLTMMEFSCPVSLCSAPSIEFTLPLAIARKRIIPCLSSPAESS